ncbi:MAG: hypothetical protein VYC11_04430, partial [Candidatus Thermoplasmatota archaeon]|nr:hypothetical protein [Candidatus Thermoplasmatota archaeon]
AITSLRMKLNITSHPIFFPPSPSSRGLSPVATMATDRIPMGRMFIDDEMLETANRILASGQWIKGPESRAFGAEWAD